MVSVAEASATQVDATAAFPDAAVTALPESGLFGLTLPLFGRTLPTEVGGMGAGPHADTYLVSTLTRGADTSDVFAVPAATPWVAVTGQWHGLGLRGNASAPMLFEVEMRAEDRLGPRAAGSI